MNTKSLLFVTFVLSFFASFSLAEEVSIPTIAKTTAAPAIASRVNGGRVETFVAVAVSSEGHALEYQFNWGDGNIGPWSAATQTHVYTYFTAMTYNVTVQARCATDTDVVSDISSPLVLTSEPVKSLASFYATWALFDRPDCWACRRNCRGDADCRCSGLGPNRICIDARDLAIFREAFYKIQPALQTCIYTDVYGSVPCICADTDRNSSGLGTNKIWVNATDLGTFASYYNKILLNVPFCLQTNYHYWTD